MSSKLPALQPIRPHQPGDDFDDDTLLPPPAPGLVSPSAEHLFDPPTLPGLGTPLDIHRGPKTARPRARPAGEGDVPLAEPEQKAHVSVHAVPPLLAEHFSDPDPTPRTATLTAVAEADTADTLPPLPLPPQAGTAVALLTYLLGVVWNRWQRRRIASRIERSLHGEGETLDRLLADLGQYAYIEQVDLLALYPLQGAEASSEAASSGEHGALAESWAARIDAEQLRTLALLAREEARLTSELLQCALARRDDERWLREPALRDEFELLIGRLAAVRVERWVQERARSHCQRHHAQLLSTLASLLEWQRSPRTGRRLPNLLLLGSLLASQRALSAARPVEPWFTTVPGRPAGVELSPALYQPLWRFQDRLLPRAALFARVLVERFAYREDLVRSGLMLVGVCAGTAALVALIVWWALSA